MFINIDNTYMSLLWHLNNIYYQPIYNRDLRIKYQKILVPHGTEMLDKALNHGAYLSKISGSEIVVLNVIEPDVVPPGASH
jgi:hypothetical protein